MALLVKYKQYRMAMRFNIELNLQDDVAIALREEECRPK